MILPFERLKEVDFQLSGINLFIQRPTYRTLDIESRRTNGFLFILQGECRYSFQDGWFDLAPGAVAYLPVGSVHRLEVLTPEIEFYRVDFTLRVDGEVALFSDVPQLMCSTAGRECAEAFTKLAEDYLYLHDSVGKTELLCTVFRTLQNAGGSFRERKLAPAASYLLEHLTEKLSCAYLASLCYLSTSQFYSLFREEYGMTPLEYRDTLLMERAGLLLRDGSFSVKEVANMLGFESVSYFSRFFKKKWGLSPSRYMKREETGDSEP